MVRVPRGVGSRTRSGPEGSSLKRSPAGAAGAPGPEPRAAVRRPAAGSRRGVHGPLRALTRSARRRSTSGWRADSAKPGGTTPPGAGHACRACSRFDLAARRVDVHAPVYLPGLRAADPCGARAQVEREQRDRRVVGDADGPAAEVDRRRCPTSAIEVAFDLLLAREFVQFVVRGAVLRRRVGEQARARPARRSPSTSAAACPRAGAPSSRTRRPAEDAQDRRSEERVAGVDRQPDGREGGEHDDRQHAGRRPRQRPPRQPQQRQHTADRRAEERGRARISPMRRGTYSGTFAMPVLRSSVVAVWRCSSATTAGSRSRAGRCASQIAGAAAASSVSPASARRSRSGSPGGRRRAPTPAAAR